MKSPYCLKARSIAGRLAASGVLIAIFVSGCADTSSTVLPPLTPDPRPLLTKEEQAKAIADMSAKKEARRTEALREIERR